MNSRRSSPPIPEALPRPAHWGGREVRREFRRKAFHLLALVIPLGYLILTRPVALWILGAFALLSVAVDFSRRRVRYLNALVLRIFRWIMREHERRGLSGLSYLLVASFLCLALFPRPLAVAALFFFIVGDGLAGLVGRFWGRIRLGQKSLEGSLACLAGSVVVVALVPGLSWPVGILGALAATLVELLPLPWDDNFRVPFFSGATMYGALLVLGG